MSTQRDINNLAMVGRLTRDVEVRYFSTGGCVGEFSLAVNSIRKRGDQWEEAVSFFPVLLYGKRAESLRNYLLKGTQIAVKGELFQQRWEYDGKNQSKVVIQASEIQLLGKTQQQSNPGRVVPQPVAQVPSQPVVTQEADRRGPEFFADDIPF